MLIPGMVLNQLTLPGWSLDCVLEVPGKGLGKTTSIHSRISQDGRLVLPKITVTRVSTMWYSRQTGASSVTAEVKFIKI